MKPERSNLAANTVPPTPPALASVSGSAYWEEREHKEKKREALVEAAILATKELSDHLNTYSDKRWWYRANEAMNALWKIR
jgi:hypothetical protein